jgi:hypothetical protein
MQLEFKVMSASFHYVQCERVKSSTALKTQVNKETGTGSNHGRHVSDFLITTASGTNLGSTRHAFSGYPEDLAD